MNRLDILEALAEAEAEIAKQEVWGFGPDGFGPYPYEVLNPPRQPVPHAARRWTGKPRKGSKQWRKEHGGLV